MKLKAAHFLVFSLYFVSAGFSQTKESEGYLTVQFMHFPSGKSLINIVNPAGETERLPLEPYRLSVEGNITVSTNNQVVLLKVLEAYRKKEYELIGVTSELSGTITNYILKKRQ